MAQPDTPGHWLVASFDTFLQFFDLNTQFSSKNSREQNVVFSFANANNEVGYAAPILDELQRRSKPNQKVDSIAKFTV